MKQLVAFVLSAEYEEFSGGSVALLDGEAYDVGEALELGNGRIVLGPGPRESEDGTISEAEAIRSRRDAVIVDALAKYPALEEVEVERGDEPLSFTDVDVTLPVGPTLQELRQRAGELDISGRSGMDKAQLAEAIAEEEARLAAIGPETSTEVNGAGESGETSDGEGGAGDGEGSTEGSDD
jgi:hypothetical protein